jgi:hypothetical protein
MRFDPRLRTPSPLARLLLEAKEQLEHGGFMDWVENHVGTSHSSALNYMAAARAVAKFPTVANLKMRASLLYQLGDNEDLYDSETLAAIFKEAETKWVNADRAFDIECDILNARDQQEDETDETEDPALPDAPLEQSEPEDDLPPPELPEPEPSSQPDLVVESFDKAIASLLHLHTKPLKRFTVTTHTRYDLQRVADFLSDLIRAYDASTVVLGNDVDAEASAEERRAAMADIATGAGVTVEQAEDVFAVLGQKEKPKRRRKTKALSEVVW